MQPRGRQYITLYYCVTIKSAAIGSGILDQPKKMSGSKKDLLLVCISITRMDCPD
ncbi:hypothetical protein Namu_2074 [Nakamurella multipartita DSM 44233]|uniref:Uncharacterized protein n=1 Tax=Nakamurella multipartita (strain ATCC 700099 / DSM 44233 / CIP 104796 / JCM 9543 / NBRC 105858 / Y-104) TaxID=479431 RepID=C8XI84_NAKMY|nr:hypothetical protein Namu_2074 [Nakamurella multipartita DSM 44233]